MEKQQWHDWRRQGIGASDAPVIMGVSPWKTYRQLWEEKVFGIESQQENAAMRRGKELEGEAIQFFENAKGILLEEQACLEHSTLKWMRATLDGISPELKVLVEVKTSRSLHQEVPEHYYPQLQHQLAVTGYKMAYYVIYDGMNGNIIEVERDDGYIADLIKKEKEFWKYVQNAEEPPLQAADYKNMDGNPDWKDLAEQYKEIEFIMAELEEKKNFLRSQFILFAEGHNARGEGITVTQCTKKGMINYALIPELQHIDLEQYRKQPSKYWKILPQKDVG